VSKDLRPTYGDAKNINNKAAPKLAKMLFNKAAELNAD
jgi:hypothetical protein